MCEKTGDAGEKRTLRIVNIGLPGFYEAIASQNVPVLQLDWRPPARQPQEIQDLLDMFI